MLPSAATEVVLLPSSTPTEGSPKRAALAGPMRASLRPFSIVVKEPSGNPIVLPGPDTFSVMVFPFSRFVNESITDPVNRPIRVPSEALSIFSNSLLTGKVTRISNPQYAAGRVTGDLGWNCHLGPRASAGDAVTTPPDKPSSAPSATITPSRLMAITPLRGQTGVAQGRGLSSGPQTRSMPGAKHLGDLRQAFDPAGTRIRWTPRRSDCGSTPSIFRWWRWDATLL